MLLGTQAITYNQMVVDSFTHADIDRVFQALADATRRDIMHRVILREQSVSSLAERYSMSFAAVQKHVAALERAALVVKRRRGREQIVQGNPVALRRAARLLDDYEMLWRDRFARIDDLVTNSTTAATARTD